MLPPILFYSFLHRRIFAVPQHLAELHGIRVALRGEQQHLAEPVQADGLPQVLVLVRLHQSRDQAHAHRAGLAGDHRGVALHRHAQHPHSPGADPVRAGDEGGDMVAQNVPGEDVGLSAGQARHDGLEIAFHDPRLSIPCQGALVQAVRKVPVQYAKRIVGNKQYGGVRQYIPLKMNAANVMPIIFAQALMFIPALFSGTAFAAAFSSMTGFWYNFTLAVLVIAFTYFYTAIIINPQMMADDMKRNGGFIPGVKPGKQTVNYIDTIMTRITLPGSFFLAIVAILPALAMKFLGIQQSFAYFYGGTSLLIMVGVVLDTLKQIESYLLMRHYDGLMKTGRIQGRH